MPACSIQRQIRPQVQQNMMQSHVGGGGGFEGQGMCRKNVQSRNNMSTARRQQVTGPSSPNHAPQVLKMIQLTVGDGGDQPASSDASSAMGMSQPPTN